MKISLLVSGDLGFSMLKLIHNISEIEFIATDRQSASISNYANNCGIPIFIGNPRGGNLYSFARQYRTLVLLSINYLFIIDQDVIELFKYAINFHGSLLPKYRGRTPHVWAIINNEVETGVTAHLIDKGCDSGDIILQKTIKIEPDSTGNSILEKYVQIYPLMIVEVLDDLKSNSTKSTPQDHSKATLFPKRTSLDGEIQWNWQKERIKNWVRAQSNPYPGAFTFLSGEKIIIDKVQFSDFGFNADSRNGLILADVPIILVKTPNGVIELSEVRNNRNLCSKGKILGNEN